MDLTCVSNEAGVEGHGLAILIKNRQVKKLICSFVGDNYDLVNQYFHGDVELELVPQGSLVEKLRAAGAGIPAFYTSTGVGSIVGEGGIV